MAEPEVSVTDCDVIIKKYLNTEDVTVTSFSLNHVSGDHLELKIEAHHNQITKTCTFFVKSTSNIPKIYDIVANFKNVVPQFEASPFPYICHTRSNLVVFENLKSQNFQNHNEALDFDHLLVVLKALATLHAVSFAFEEVKTDKFRLDTQYALLHLNFNLKAPEVTQLLSSLLDNEESVSQTIKDLEDRQFSSKFRKSLCHGNLKTKNIMFRYDNGSPKYCKLLNTKSNFYAPPVYDVLQVIFFNTTEDLRQQHLHTLLRQYFEFLKEELKEYNLDIKRLATIDDFLLSAHYFLPLIKIETALHLPKQELLPSLKETLTCPLLSREDCYVIIHNKIGTTNYDFVSFEVTPLSDVSGFLGEYNRLEMHIRLFSEDKTLHCFIKSSPRSGPSYVIAQELETFPREVFMYHILAPQMKSHGINLIDECLPPCYFYRPEEFMVFEDMHRIGYKNLDALQPLNFTCVSLLMKKLARFHACSIILEEKVSEELHKPYCLLEAYTKYFNEPLFFEHETHLGARQFMVGIKAIPVAIDLFPEIKTEANQKNYLKFWPKFKELFYEVIKTSDRFRNVLSHGDIWTSNTLIKFEDEKPIDCVYIDFQIVRYCPPAYDILSVLHRTTTRPTRLKYEDQLLQIYYEELGQCLESYGLSIEKIYPHEDFICCINYMKPQMLMQAAVECTLTMCTPEEISLFLADEETCSTVFFEDRTQFMMTMCQKSGLYRNALKDCLLDIYDYIDSVCLE